MSERLAQRKILTRSGLSDAGYIPLLQPARYNEILPARPEPRRLLAEDRVRGCGPTHTAEFFQHCGANFYKPLQPREGLRCYRE